MGRLLQVAVTEACFLIHNHLRIFNANDEKINDFYRARELFIQSDDYDLYPVADDPRMYRNCEEWRDTIANSMWNDYQNYLRTHNLL